MKILIEAPFQLSIQAESSIREKVGKLTTFWEKIEQANVFFKEDDGQVPNGILAQIRLSVPGPDIFASDSAAEFLEALDGAVEKVERQLRKYKEIKRDHQENKDPIFWSPEESN